MTAAKMCHALRCPYDWYEPLKDKPPTCKRGDDCDRCILSFLVECDSSDFVDERIESR